MSLVERYCLVPMQLGHHFAASVQNRGHGGIVLLSSGAALVDGQKLVVDEASRVFDMVMAEALWAELNVRGVDILGLVLGVTNTPVLGRTLVGVASSPTLAHQSKVQRRSNRFLPKRVPTCPKGRSALPPMACERVSSHRGDVPQRCSPAYCSCSTVP